MQFDFQLAPGASQTIDVKGRFFKYKAGTGLIRVRTSLGGFVDVLPGQGIENVHFTSLTIADRSNAANAGSILAGDFDFRDDRITGTVDIVDGGKSRTIAGLAYMGAVPVVGIPGAFPHVQLYNGPGSGRNLVVESVAISCSGAAQIDFGPSSAFLASLFSNSPQSKLFAAAPRATVAQLRFQNNTPLLLTNSFGNALVQANQSFPVTFKEPVIVAPGYGFLIQAEAVNVNLVATFEFFEDPI